MTQLQILRKFFISIQAKKLAEKTMNNIFISANDSDSCLYTYEKYYWLQEKHCIQSKFHVFAPILSKMLKVISLLQQTISCKKHNDFFTIDNFCVCVNLVNSVFKINRDRDIYKLKWIFKNVKKMFKTQIDIRKKKKKKNEKKKRIKKKQKNKLKKKRN